MDTMDVEEGRRPRVDTGDMEGWKKCLLIFLGIGLLVTIIILPISFVGVEYYEVGYVTSKESENTVRIWASGRGTVKELYKEMMYLCRLSF